MSESEDHLAGTYKIAGPVGRCNAAESGNIDFICTLVWAELSQEVHAIKAHQEIPDMTRLTTIAALFHLYFSAPASCMAKTSKTDAINKSNAPGISIWAKKAGRI